MISVCSFLKLFRERCVWSFWWFYNCPTFCSRQGIWLPIYANFFNKKLSRRIFYWRRNNIEHKVYIYMYIYSYPSFTHWKLLTSFFLRFFIPFITPYIAIPFIETEFLSRKHIHFCVFRERSHEHKHAAATLSGLFAVRLFVTRGKVKKYWKLFRFSFFFFFGGVSAQCGFNSRELFYFLFYLIFTLGLLALCSIRDQFSFIPCFAWKIIAQRIVDNADIISSASDADRLRLSRQSREI